MHGYVVGLAFAQRNIPLLSTFSDIIPVREKKDTKLSGIKTLFSLALLIVTE